MAFVCPSDKNNPLISFHLDSRTKLLMLLVLSILSISINNVIFLLPLFGVLIFISLISNISPRKLWKYMKPVVWLTLPIFVIQVLFTHEKAEPILVVPTTSKFLAGFVFLSIGSLLYACSICLRILILALGSCIFSLTTDSNDFLRSLTKIGLPFELAFASGLVIYFLPMIISESVAVRDALETRGISLRKGRFKNRLLSFKVLVGSILMNFLEKSKFQAIAMDSRGFNSKKKRTTLREIKFRKVDLLFCILAICFTAGMFYLFREEINLFANIWN